MNKYFSINISDENRMQIHDTLEDARKSCLIGATTAFNDAVEWDGSFNDEAADFDNAVYGLVLGEAKPIIREPRDEYEKEFLRDSGFSYIVETPDIIENQCVGWISVKDKVPNDDQEVLVYSPHELAGVGIAKYNWKYNCYTSFEFGELTDITHWLPVPFSPKG